MEGILFMKGPVLKESGVLASTQLLSQDVLDSGFISVQICGGGDGNGGGGDGGGDGDDR